MKRNPVRRAPLNRTVGLFLTIFALAAIGAKAPAQPQDIVTAYKQAEAKRKAKTVSYSEYHRALLEIAASCSMVIVCVRAP